MQTLILRCSFCAAVVFSAASAARAQSDELEQWLEIYHEQLPTSAAGCRTANLEEVAKAADAVEKWTAVLAGYRGLQRPEEIIDRADRLVAAKHRVDDLLRQHLEIRSQFAEQPAGDERRQAIRSFLRITTGLIDLSGRMQMQLSEAVDFAAFRVAGSSEHRQKLIDRLRERKSQMGASVLSLALIDPPPEFRDRVPPASAAMKRTLLKFIAETGELSTLQRVVDFVRSPSTPPELKVEAAHTLRRLCLPQDLRPEEKEPEAKPEITAAELHEILAGVDASRLSADDAARHVELLSWLDVRRKQGLEGDSYQLGHIEVRPGDWMLMRNPSPYNLFTDLDPGLFTHVGVVALENGSDGKRRMVIVDLPERGRNIPAINVEVFVQRSRHYMFVRHPDEQVARAMSQRAVEVIGNPSEFDLNFRTARVPELKGQPIQGRHIHTYCAGLLLLCAQETELSRDQFFPISETMAGGHAPENLKRVGISFGDDFISPTGALFSPMLQVAGWRLPEYDPRREVEERIFDHFADGVRTKKLEPSHTTYQALRLKMAEAAKSNPALDKALRLKEQVGDAMDLVAAAKAQAVVETLDEIAYSASGDFFLARAAVTVPRVEDLKRDGFSDEQIADARRLRQRHADLVQRFTQNRLPPRDARKELVAYYVARGKKEMDERFFGAAATGR